jgi:hypothetical protein
MGDLTANDNRNKLVSHFHNNGRGGLTIPKPFEREIFLFDTHVAGTTHIEGIKELEPHIKIDAELDFFREPDNPHDPKAIVIKNASGVKVGYVPEADNAVFSRLMDAGKLLFAKIADKTMIGNWLKIDIKVYLRE